MATSKAAFYINAAQLTAIMVAVYDGGHGLAELLNDRRITAVLIGPGCGVSHETRDLVAAALSSEASTVIDADGMTCFADNPSELFEIVKSRAVPVIMTPHDGEFERLFPDLVSVGSKLDRARKAAELSGAVIVLKGPDTVVAAPDGLAAIAENAPPWLATAGSGDSLAGLITGLLAQGMAAFDAAAAGVWIHGELGAAFGPGLIAEDLAELIPPLLKNLDKRGSKLF